MATRLSDCVAKDSLESFDLEGRIPISRGVVMLRERKGRTEYEEVCNADVPLHANIRTIVRLDKLAHNRCPNF